MKIREVAEQLHSLTNGHINGETFSKAELQEVLKMWLRTSNRVIIQVELPDGLWLCEVTRECYGYDYYIPDTREHEAILYNVLGIQAG